MVQKIEKQLLDFLGHALWNASYNPQPLSREEWQQVYECAEKQGVVPLMLKGAAPVKAQMPPELLAKLRGYSISVIMRNERLLAVQNELMALLKAHQIPCAILKGCSLSVCYPQPEARPLGDIDVLIHPQDMERTEGLLCEQGYRPEHTDHPFHTDFYGKGAVVEIHRQVSNFPDSKGGRIAREIMQSALEKRDEAILAGSAFPVLKPRYQALALLLHMERHMTTGGIGLRQLCDWALFIHSVDAAVWKEQVLPEIERCGLMQFAKVITATCVECLHMPDEHMQWCREISLDMRRAFMEDMLRGGSIGSRTDENDISGIFIERGNGGAQKNALRLMFEKLTMLANQHFPVTKKCPLLLPIFWIYIPLRYWVRSLLGKRKKISLFATVTVAGERRKLYNELSLFDTEKTK